MPIIKPAQNTNTTQKQHKYTKQTNSKQTNSKQTKENITGKDIYTYWATSLHSEETLTSLF
jgi:hypothetical protein